jgi:hypothetical protein
MDHRSSKVCAAAGPVCKHIHAETVAIATILKERRMIASQMNATSIEQLKVMRLRSPREELPRAKKIMNTSGTMLQADFKGPTANFDLHTKRKSAVGINKTGRNAHSLRASDDQISNTPPSLYARYFTLTHPDMLHRRTPSRIMFCHVSDRSGLCGECRGAASNSGRAKRPPIRSVQCQSQPSWVGDT